MREKGQSNEENKESRADMSEFKGVHVRLWSVLDKHNVISVKHVHMMHEN